MKLKLSLSFFAFGVFSFCSLSAQDIEWQQVLGGIHSEYLYDVKATPDYGFLLAGSSFSGTTGNKSGESRGDLDYFLWKMDESGKMEWQETFGSPGNDYLYCVGLTREGGYILGGASATLSDTNLANDDKKHPGFGNMDFWIVKLDPERKEEWQLTLGGIGNDQLQSIQQTADGGFIVGGSSASPASSEEEKQIGKKQSEAFGNFDYWVIKLTANGTVEWEKSFGGLFSDQLKEIVETEDGYLIGGISNSPGGRGNKTAPNYGSNDFWLIKTDKKGSILWQKTYGGEGDERLAGLIKTEKGYLIAGSTATSGAFPEGGKTAVNAEGVDFWVMEIDKEGHPLWDATYDIGKWDVLVQLTQAENNSFLLGGYASGEIGSSKTNARGVNDFIVIKINAEGESLWRKTLGGTGSDHLKGVVQMRDGGYLLAGNSNSKKSDDKDKASLGGNDYWIVKLGNEAKKAEERKIVEVYPNPTRQFITLVISQDFNEARAEVFDLNGRKLQTKEVPYRSTAIDLQSYPPGIYILKIILDGKVHEVKVIKQGSK